MGEQATGGAAHSHKRVIVAGYGPVGRVVGEKLCRCGVDVTIVDLNRQTIDRQAKLGHRAVLGDIGERQVLIDASVQKVDALILTIPDEEAALRACRIARELCPGLFIATRMNHPSSGMHASAAGADHVTIEELVTAEAMQTAVIDHLVDEAKDDSAPTG